MGESEGPGQVNLAREVAREAAEEGEDPWESFKERVAKSIDSDPSWNKERRGSGRWP